MPYLSHILSFFLINVFGFSTISAQCQPDFVIINQSVTCVADANTPTVNIVYSYFPYSETSTYVVIENLATGLQEYVFPNFNHSVTLANVGDGVSDVQFAFFKADAPDCRDTVTINKSCDLPYEVCNGAPIMTGWISGGHSDCGSNNGSYTVHVDGGTPPYSYLWSNGATEAFNGNLMPGNYQVTVTDQTGCSSIFTPNGPIVDTTNARVIVSPVDTALCLGEQAWLVATTVFPATETALPFLVTWTNEAGVVIGTGDSLLVSWEGVYTATAYINEGGPGCDKSATAEVFIRAGCEDPTVPLCAQPVVNLLADTLLRCEGNPLEIAYTNPDSFAAFGSILTLILPEWVDSISLPNGSPSVLIDSLDAITGERFLEFNMGTLPQLSSGSFFVVIYSCNAIYEAGDAVCLEAELTAWNACPDNDLWSGASVDITATCATDSVVFEITNIGTADMTVPLEYIVVEDGVVLISQTDPPLEAGISQLLSMAASGTTFSVVTNQEPFHPGWDMPTAFVEDCGEPFKSEGFALLYPPADSFPGREFFCAVLAGEAEASAVKPLVAPRRLTIFPNPNRGNFSVDIPGEMIGKAGELIIYNTTGKPVYRASLGASVRVYVLVVELPADLYTAVLITADGDRALGRVVVL